MKMFKKSLIAASVAAVATTAVAGTITANSSNKIALEGAVAAGTIGIITTSTTEVKNDIQVVLTPAADYIV
ncbi:MAG TPA: hypothetical protein DCF92_02605, partial [Idiomarina sp.]|nr:hypothetical protein [Idiomarina sp.]